MRFFDENSSQTSLGAYNIIIVLKKSKFDQKKKKTEQIQKQ